MGSIAAFLQRHRGLIATLFSVALLAGIYAFLKNVPSIHIVKAERKEIVRTVVASGRVLAPSRAMLGSMITGKVRKVYVREGEVVEAGAVLVELDSRELEAAVSQARAQVKQASVRSRQIISVFEPIAKEDVAQAQAELALAESDWNRTQQLYTQGVLSPSAKDDALQKYVLARSRLRSMQQQASATISGGVDRAQATASQREAEATLAMAEARLSYARITAPTKGIVLFRDAQVGDVVQPSKSLIIFEPIGDHTLVVDFDEKDLAEIKLGQRALASADAYPNASFEASVIYIAPRVDPKRATIEVRLHIDKPPSYLRPDMTVSVEIEVGRHQNALSAPLEAIRDIASRAPWVLAVRRHVTVRLPVRIGLISEERAEIVGGITEHEVLVPIAEMVAPGKHVRTKR